MAVTHEITEFDRVELTEAVGEAPAGARGGVLEIYDDGVAMVELTSLPAEMGIDRIVYVPMAKLRAVKPAGG